MALPPSPWLTPLKRRASYKEFEGLLDEQGRAELRRRKATTLTPKIDEPIRSSRVQGRIITMAGSPRWPKISKPINGEAETQDYRGNWIDGKADTQDYRGALERRVPGPPPTSEIPPPPPPPPQAMIPWLKKHEEVTYWLQKHDEAASCPPVKGYVDGRLDRRRRRWRPTETETDDEDSMPIDDPEADTIDYGFMNTYLKGDRTSWDPDACMTSPIIRKMIVESVEDEREFRRDFPQSSNEDAEPEPDDVFTRPSVWCQNMKQQKTPEDTPVPISQYEDADPISQYKTQESIGKICQQDAGQEARRYASKCFEAGPQWTTKLDKLARENLYAKRSANPPTEADWSAMYDCEDLFDTIPASEAQIEERHMYPPNSQLQHHEYEERKQLAQSITNSSSSSSRSYQPVPEFGAFTQAAFNLVELLKANVDESIDELLERH